jgi:Flp pilus assembly protein TadD
MVIQIGDNLVRAWYNMGISLANLGNYKEAIMSYDKALELNPDDAQTIYEKAISLNNLGKHKNAEKLVSKAREMGLNV